MRLLELFEQSGKTVAVTFGRLNPPTIGHQKLVDAVLKQKADAHFLFVSHTHQPTGKNKTRLSNPLPFDVKLGFIQQAFPNIDIGDTSVSTAIGMLQFLEKQGFDNVIFVGGSDRVAAFTELFNAQNGIDYNLKSIKVVSSGARDPDAEGAEGMSASKMRAAAIANDFESFKTGLPAGLQGDAEQVFTAVRQGLEPWLEGVGEGVGDKRTDPAPGKEFVSNKFYVKFTPDRIEFYRRGELVYTKSGDYSNPTRGDYSVAKGITSRLWEKEYKQGVAEGWSKKYKSSINCSNPKGFSQKAHCAGKKKNESVAEGHGRYYCSTDKKWKTRKGPKQERSS